MNKRQAKKKNKEELTKRNVKSAERNEKMAEKNEKITLKLKEIAEKNKHLATQGLRLVPHSTYFYKRPRPKNTLSVLEYRAKVCRVKPAGKSNTTRTQKDQRLQKDYINQASAQKAKDDFYKSLKPIKNISAENLFDPNSINKTTTIDNER